MSRKVPQSVKTNRKIDAAVREALQVQAIRYAKATIAQADQYKQEIEQLKQAIPKTDGFLVYNWKQGWKWFSNLALTAIVAINTAPIPPEILDALPPDTRQYVTIGLAVIGIAGRFINQSKQKDDANV